MCTAFCKFKRLHFATQWIYVLLDMISHYSDYFPLQRTWISRYKVFGMCSL